MNIDTLMGWSLCEQKDFTLGIIPGKGMDGQTAIKNDRKVCPLPFYTLSVNFNGLVSVCCVDWSWGTIVGDVRKESLTDIWNGRPLRALRMRQLKNERSKIKVCANCQYMQGIKHESDIDNYSDELIEKYG